MDVYLWFKPMTTPFINKLRLKVETDAAASWVESLKWPKNKRDIIDTELSKRGFITNGIYIMIASLKN